MAQLTVGDDEADVAHRTAARLTELVERAVSARGRALVSLSGGTTPRRLYECLADPGQPWRSRIPWPRLHLFWGDERHVPPDHPDSNYAMARTALLDHVPVPVDHVHRIRAELPDVHDAAADYERTLSVASGFNRMFLLDVMLLGVGADAHIASIFPGSELLDPRREPASVGRRVAAVRTPRGDAWRITLTPHAVLDAEALIVLVAGAHKAAAVRAALHEPLDLMRFPAQLLRAADGRADWFLDRAAAGLVRSG